jgi:hypothetical protein
MQLVVARVATAATVASEASTRTALETAKQSAVDRATAVQGAAATATTEQDSLAMRLAQAEAGIEELWAIILPMMLPRRPPPPSPLSRLLPGTRPVRLPGEDNTRGEGDGAGVGFGHRWSRPHNGQLTVLRGD